MAGGEEGLKKRVLFLKEPYVLFCFFLNVLKLQSYININLTIFNLFKCTVCGVENIHIIV